MINYSSTTVCLLDLQASAIWMMKSQIDQEALLVTCSNREGYQIREGSKILDLVIFGPHFGFWLKGDIIIQLDIQEDEKMLLPFWGVLQNKTVTSCYGTAKDYPNSLDLTS